MSKNSGNQIYGPLCIYNDSPLLASALMAHICLRAYALVFDCICIDGREDVSLLNSSTINARYRRLKKARNILMMIR